MARRTEPARVAAALALLLVVVWIAKSCSDSSQGLVPDRSRASDAASAPGTTDPVTAAGRARRVGGLDSTSSSTVAPESSHERSQFFVRDLRDGAALQGVRVSTTIAGRRVEGETGVDGCVDLPGAEWTAIEVGSAEWNPQTVLHSILDENETIWLYRRAKIRGRVVRESTREPIAGARVSIRVAGTRPGEAEGIGNYGWLDRLASDYAIARGPDATTAQDGSFELDVPVVSGVHVHAISDGMAPSSVRVPFTSPSADVPDLVVILRDRVMLRGRVVSPSGQPVARAQVWIRVRQARDGTSLPRPEERMGDSAVTYARSADGRAEIVFAKRVWTADDGRFEVPSPGSGLAAFHVFAAGYRVAGVLAGSTDENRDDYVIRLDAQPVADRLRLFLGDKHMTGGKFIASDLSSEDGFEVYNDYVEVGHDGSVPSEWLVEGHRYRFIVKGDEVPRGSQTGLILWRGQSTVNVLDLSMRKQIE